MEEFWDNNGPYVLAKLADRTVPIPRDNEPQISLYALCRAWVRNNPTLPLVAEAPSPQQSHPRDAAVRVGGPTGPSSNGDASQAGPSQPPQETAAPTTATAAVTATAAAAATATSTSSSEPLTQPLQDPQPQLDPQAPAAPPQAQAQALPQDTQPNGLISILPPLLPLTALESSTVAPTYPLDDFDAGDPEEALRKFKDHWVAVRQYHQALRAAKLSRHRERLLVLLGEPSLLQPPQPPALQPPLQVPLHMQVAMQMQMAAAGAPPGLVLAAAAAAAAGAQQQPGGAAAAAALQQMQMLGPDGQPMVSAAAAAAVESGVLPPGLFFQGGGAGPGQGLLPGMAGFAVAPPGGSAVSAADAQAALAVIMNLGAAAMDSSAQRPQLSEGEGLPVAAQLLQQQLFLQQQQQLGLLVGGPVAAGAAGQMSMLPPLEVLQALQQQQQPAVAVGAHQPMLGQLSAAVAAAADTPQGQQGQGQQPAGEAGAAGAGLTSAPEVPEPMGTTAPPPLPAEDERQAPVSLQGADGMDVDSGQPPGS